MDVDFSNCLHQVYTMASAKVILYKHKTLKDGSHPVLIQVIYHRKIKRISTHLSSLPDNWDDETSSFKTTHPEYKSDSNLLDSIKSRIHKAMNYFDLHDLPFTYERFRGRYGKQYKPKSIIEMFDETVERFRLEGRIGNSNIYKDTGNAIKRFISNRKIVLHDVDFSFIKRFETYLRERKNSDSTILLRMRTLRALFNHAISEGVVPEELYPFAKNTSDTRKYSLSRLRTGTNPRALSADEITAFKQFDVKKYPHLDLAHKVFLFSYFANGMNYTDMAKLTWDHMHNGRLKYKRQKTKLFIDVKLSQPLKEILDQFEGRSKTFVFPILHSQRHISPVSIANRIKKCRAKHNRDLKEIASIAGIKILLTSYGSRHSYAMALRRNGIDQDRISHNLGHSDLRVTQHYLQALDNSYYDEANEVL